MDIQAQVEMLERRGEHEAAELLREIASDVETLPVGKVLSYQGTARDFTIRPVLART